MNVLYAISMIVVVAVFGQPAVAAANECQGQEASLDHLPQTQVAAAALLMVTFGTGHGNMVLGYPRFCAIDETAAQLRRRAGDPSNNFLDVVGIRKIDNCNFEATTEWGQTVVIARLALGQLTSEYHQSSRRYSSISEDLRVRVTGVGGKPATCWRDWFKSMLGSDGREFCNDGLVMTFRSDDPLAARAMRALAFLQQSCPPRRLGF
jgi:hypothetical protein